MVFVTLIGCTAPEGRGTPDSVENEASTTPSKGPVDPQELPRFLPELEFGTVVRETTGPAESTTRIWFDDYGRRARIETTRHKPSPETQVELLRDGTRALWSDAPNSPSPSPHPHRRPARLSAEGGEIYSPEKLKLAGWEEAGTRVSDGLECRVWKHPARGSTLYRYRGLDIYLDHPMSGSEVRTVEANFEVRPANTLFEFPAGATRRHSKYH